jgi:hypothetical protein
MKARLKVIELLRTLWEVQQTYNSGSGGGGVQLMPSDYANNSYPELERCLGEMRNNGRRQLWWHLSARYRWGSEHIKPLPTVKTRQGRKPILPPRCELLIAGETLGTSPGGPVLMVVKYKQWLDGADPRYVEAGLDHLVSSMHGGDTSQIALPKEFMERLMSDVEPQQSHLPGTPFVTA